MNRNATGRPILACLLLVAAAITLAPAVHAAQPRRTTPTEGEQLITRGDWVAAEKHDYKRIKSDPDDAEALRKLGFVELRRPGGDAVRARKYLERARKLDPENPLGLFLLARTYDVLGSADLARRTFEELVALGPGRDDPQRASAVHLARFSLAVAAVRRGDADEAKRLFHEVLRREKRHAYVQYELAMLAQNEGRTDEAIELYEKTLEALDRWAPTESWPYPQARYAYIRENARYELARLLLGKGEVDGALELLEPMVETVTVRAGTRRREVAPAPKSPLEGKPDARFENAPFYCAKALAAAGRAKEARKMLKAFSRMRLGDPALRDEARRLYKEMK